MILAYTIIRHGFDQMKMAWGIPDSLKSLNFGFDRRLKVDIRRKGITLELLDSNYRMLIGIARVTLHKVNLFL